MPQYTLLSMSQYAEYTEYTSVRLSILYWICLSIPSILSMPQYASVYFTEYVSVCRVYWVCLRKIYWVCLSMPVHPRHLLLYRQPPRRVACEIILEPLCTFCILWPASYFHESSCRIVFIKDRKRHSIRNLFTQLKTCSLN